MQAALCRRNAAPAVLQLKDGQASPYPIDVLQGPLVHEGDFLQDEDDASADRAKGGIRTRMHHYFQKQKNVVAPAVSVS